MSHIGNGDQTTEAVTAEGETTQVLPNEQDTTENITGTTTELNLIAIGMIMVFNRKMQHSI